MSGAGYYGINPTIEFNSTRMKVWLDNHANCKGTVYTAKKINFWLIQN